MSGSSLITYFKSIRKHHYLIAELTKREFALRYSGSFFGLFWSFITPVLILGVYTFVFKSVFHTRWVDAGDTSNVQFALILFIGLMLHSLFSDCAMRAPTLIQCHSSYVKRVVFPLEILPLVLVINSFLHTSLSFLVWTLFYLIINHTLPFTLIYTPLIILPFLIFNIGIVLFLSVMGVYVRDVAQIMGVIITVSMFMTPIFYPISAVPHALQTLIYLNPLTFAIVELRNCAIFDMSLNWTNWAIYSGFSVFIFALGFMFFQKSRRGFADVL
jgi:lipopolysaccharide transport system permease protein